MAAKARAAISGAAIAADALRYRGAGYVYGGTASRVGDWDCSSFISYVLGHDLGLQLPGGRWGNPGFPPALHGPVVEDYAAWDGAQTVAQPRRGDLVMWVGVGAGGHIGIVLGPNQMVSALDTNQGTLVTPIEGYGPTPTWIYRRVNGASAGGIGTTGTPGSGGGVLAAMLAGALVVAGMTGVVLAAAAAAGVAGLWAAGWAARKVARP